MVEEQLRFVVVASGHERSITDLCKEFGISRQSGHVWLKRYRQGGSGAMADQSRRPAHSPRRTASESEQAVVDLRRRWPDWGAAKLARILNQQKPDVALQARTVHRILDRYGLIEPQERGQHASKRFERSAPNELWQMNFKGPQRSAGGSAVGPLSVMDDHSRYLLGLRHLGSTRLSIWIMRLGIWLLYSGIGHPQTQGKVERMHGALQRAIRKRKTDPENQHWLDIFRDEYGHRRPAHPVVWAGGGAQSPSLGPTCHGPFHPAKRQLRLFMSLGEQFATLCILALPIASVAWTITHEEVFREPREWCQKNSQTCNRLYKRKLFYLFTCEYCFSHYIAIIFLLITRFKMLYTDWRGYLISGFALVWIANIYMNIYSRVRLDIKRERVEIAATEQNLNSSDS